MTANRECEMSEETCLIKHPSSKSSKISAGETSLTVIKFVTSTIQYPLQVRCIALSQIAGYSSK